MRHHKLFLLSGCLAFSRLSSVFATEAITPVPHGAAVRIAAVQVHVAPDHRDWTYELGQTAHFKVTVSLDRLVIDGGTLQEPGFMCCQVSASIAGHTAKGAGTAAFAPGKIIPPKTEPSDSAKLWQDGKAELAAIPLEPRLALDLNHS